MSISCCGGKVLSEETAIALNNDAVEMIFTVDEKCIALKDSILNMALIKLNEAISKDSLYVRAYQNKSHILRMLNRDREAISTMEQVLNIKETPENNFILGAIYEKVRDTLSATKYYRKAIMSYDELLNVTQDSISYMNLYFMLSFIEDEDPAISRIRESLKNNSCFPWEEFDIFFKNFDRAEFINQL